jgi:hypothetical protein
MTIRSSFQVVILLASVVAVRVSSGADSLPDASKLKNEYEKTLRLFTRMDGIWKSEDFELDEDGKEPRPTGNVKAWTVLRNKDQAKITSRDISSNNRPTFFYEDASQVGKNWLAIFPQGAVLGMQNISVAKNAERLGFPPAAPMYGYILNESIPVFLSSSTLSVDADQIDGQLVYVLQGTKDDIRISLWLDPALDFAARRIEYHKENPPGKHNRRFDVTRFDRKVGIPIATEGTVTLVTGPQPVLSPVGNRVSEFPPATDAEGKVIMQPVMRAMQKESLVNIDFDPKFKDSDFELTQPIVNGTRIYMQDAPNSAFMWQDGEIVPAVNPDPLDAMRYMQSAH